MVKDETALGLQPDPRVLARGGVVPLYCFAVSHPRSQSCACWLTVLALALPALGRAEPPSLESLRALEIQRGAETIRLGSLLPAATPTIVALWASYCVACRGESGVLVEARKRWGATVVLVLADVDDPKAAATFRTRTKTPFEMLPIAPAQEDAAEALAPEGFPTNFLLSGDRIERVDRVLTAGDIARFVGAH